MVPIRRSTAALVACLSRCPADGGLALINRARGAEWLLLRADLIGELGSAWLKAIHPWRLIYALRTRRTADLPIRLNPTVRTCFAKRP